MPPVSHGPAKCAAAVRRSGRQTDGGLLRDLRLLGRGGQYDGHRKREGTAIVEQICVRVGMRAILMMDVRSRLGRHRGEECGPEGGDDVETVCMCRRYYQSNNGYGACYAVPLENSLVWGREWDGGAKNIISHRSRSCKPISLKLETSEPTMPIILPCD